MPASALADPPPRATARRLARVAVLGSLDEARAAWADLLAVAPASAYQTPGWLDAWLGTVGRAERPVLVAGFDDQGPVALLPLRRTPLGGLMVARFLGGRDANFGLGLFHPGVAWDLPILRGFLGEAARLGGIDLFWLGNQPDALGGRANPLAALPRVPSPSLQHEVPLDPDPDAFLARTLSARARKHIRQKETKLAALAPVRHTRATDPATAARLAAALLAQRESRFGPSDPDGSLQAFLVAASQAAGGARPAVELHALTCGDAIVAVFAGAGHAGRFSGMMVSFAAEDPWARFSPGELLLARVMAEKCREGFEMFDLGIGEARYKSSFCPVAVPLFDTVLGITASGRVAAAALRAGLAAKRGVKQSPRLWAAVRRLRALRRGSGRFPA